MIRCRKLWSIQGAQVARLGDTCLLFEDVDEPFSAKCSAYTVQVRAVYSVRAHLGSFATNSQLTGIATSLWVRAAPSRAELQPDGGRGRAARGRDWGL